MWACLGGCVLLSSLLHLFCSVVRGRRLAAGLLSKGFVVVTLTERRASDGCLQLEFALVCRCAALIVHREVAGGEAATSAIKCRGAWSLRPPAPTFVARLSLATSARQRTLSEAKAAGDPNLTYQVLLGPIV